MIKHSLLGIGLAIVVSAGLSSAANANLTKPQTGAESFTREIGANLILAFSQRVNLKKTVVEIRNSRGVLVEIGVLRTAKYGTDLEIPLSGPLAPDSYTIHWRAVSVQGLVDEGSYGFEVDPTLNRIPTLAQQ